MLPDAADPFPWNERYVERQTPWDLGAPHPEWRRRLDEGHLGLRGGRRAWVPGAGRGHDALWLASVGWRVIATDLAPEVRAQAGAAYEAAGVELRITDALATTAEDLGGPVDLVLEHTFLCALPLERRDDWGTCMRRVLAAGGRLAALVFPANKPEAEGGPPYRLTTETIARLLGPAFALRVDEPAVPAGARVWEQRFALFERTDAPR